MTKWITFEEFKRISEKCSECDKPAIWLPFDGTWKCYCNKHRPKEKKRWKEVKDKK